MKISWTNNCEIPFMHFKSNSNFYFHSTTPVQLANACSMGTFSTKRLKELNTPFIPKTVGIPHNNFPRLGHQSPKRLMRAARQRNEYRERPADPKVAELRVFGERESKYNRAAHLNGAPASVGCDPFIAHELIVSANLFEQHSKFKALSTHPYPRVKHIPGNDCSEEFTLFPWKWLITTR